MKAFTPEDLWYILLSVNRQIDGEEKKVDFTWRRGRVFEVDVVNEIYEDITENSRARVMKVTQKNTKKWYVFCFVFDHTNLFSRKPLPLTTVELQKAGSRLLKLAPKKVLDVCPSVNFRLVSFKGSVRSPKSSISRVSFRIRARKRTNMIPNSTS